MEMRMTHTNNETSNGTLPAWTKRAAATFGRWRDADRFTRGQMERNLAPAEVAALGQFERNLIAVGEPKTWFLPPDKSCTLLKTHPAIVRQLLHGLQIQEAAIPDLLRACRLEGRGPLGGALALEEALRKAVGEASRHGAELPKSSPEPVNVPTKTAAAADVPTEAPKTGTSEPEPTSAPPPALVLDPALSKKAQLARWLDAHPALDLQGSIPMKVQREWAQRLDCTPGAVSGHLSLLRKERGIQAVINQPKRPSGAPPAPPQSTPSSAAVGGPKRPEPPNTVTFASAEEMRAKLERWRKVFLELGEMLEAALPPEQLEERRPVTVLVRWLVQDWQGRGETLKGAAAELERWQAQVAPLETEREQARELLRQAGVGGGADQLPLRCQKAVAQIRSLEAAWEAAKRVAWEPAPVAETPPSDPRAMLAPATDSLTAPERTVAHFCFNGWGDGSDDLWLERHPLRRAAILQLAVEMTLACAGVGCPGPRQAIPGPVEAWPVTDAEAGIARRLLSGYDVRESLAALSALERAAVHRLAADMATLAAERTL